MKGLLTFAFVLALLPCRAQSIEVDLGWSYLLAPQWDRAIQVYNFSRPHLENQQPLWIHGASGSLSFMFHSQKTLRHGIHLNYAWFRSYAENESYENELNLHWFNLGYVLRYENEEKGNGFFSELRLSATASSIFRYVNDESLAEEENSTQALGIGGSMSLKAGRWFLPQSRFQFSPFALLAFTPYLYSPNAEPLLNQTKTLVANPGVTILQFQAGIALRWRKAG